MALDFPKPVIEMIRIILYAMQNPHFQPFQCEIQSWKLFFSGQTDGLSVREMDSNNHDISGSREMLPAGVLKSSLFFSKLHFYLPVVLDSSLLPFSLQQ